MNESSRARRLPDPDGVGEVVLTIIIASYNAKELLADCLQSIYDHTPSVSYEIIVIDDCSSDGTYDMVKRNFAEVRLLRNDRNVHYARSNNRALDISRGQYIYLLNADTVVLPGAIDAMIEFLRAHPDAGAVGSRLLNEDGSVQWSVKSLPGVGSALFGARSFLSRLFPGNPFTRKHIQHLDSDMKEPFVAGYVSSASVMMPVAVVKRVGHLDGRLSYHVDADYCKRISDVGYKTYYLPGATVIHLNHKGGTMVSLRRRFRSVVEFHVGSYIYFHKHIMRSPFHPYRLVVVILLFGRFLASLALLACRELLDTLRPKLQRPPSSGS